MAAVVLPPRREGRGETSIGEVRNSETFNTWRCGKQSNAISHFPFPIPKMMLRARGTFGSAIVRNRAQFWSANTVTLFFYSATSTFLYATSPATSPPLPPRIPTNFLHVACLIPTPPLPTCKLRPLCLCPSLPPMTLSVPQMTAESTILSTSSALRTFSSLTSVPRPCQRRNGQKKKTKQKEKQTNQQQRPQGRLKSEALKKQLFNIIVP